MSNEEKRSWLLQKDWRERTLPRLGRSNWEIVCDNFDDRFESGGRYCALLQRHNLDRALAHASWDLSKGSGTPGFSVQYEREPEIVCYHRFGGEEGIEPLVIYRSFHGVKESYVELSEEFRHFHNLYWDQRNGEFIKIFDDGREDPVAKIQGHRVELRMKEVHEFLSARQLHLAIYFDIVRFSDLDPDEIGAEGNLIEHTEDTLLFSFHASPWDIPEPDRRSFSRLFGKKLIQPSPIESCGFWPFESQEHEYEKFIIGVDEHGAPVEHACNPDVLANNFGSNPGAPHYLTPVYFYREVLSKYYSQPRKYRVDDGYLACAGLWGLRMDNHHKDYVVVYLGDLGRDLPKTERLYWKSFNVVPEGGVSEVAFRRDFLSQWAEPERPDFIFKTLFRHISEEWQKKRGWPIFRHLSCSDQHFFAALRIPLTDEQAEFDSQVLALAKVLIDSLNEEQFAILLGGSEKDEKGISKLERFLKRMEVPDIEKNVKFLRDLQSLRSSSVAHLKGSKYESTSKRFGIDEKDLRQVFAEILEDAIKFLQFLKSVV